MTILEPAFRNAFWQLDAIQNVPEGLYFFKKAVRRYASEGHS